MRNPSGVGKEDREIPVHCLQLKRDFSLFAQTPENSGRRGIQGARHYWRVHHPNAALSVIPNMHNCRVSQPNGLAEDNAVVKTAAKIRRAGGN